MNNKALEEVNNMVYEDKEVNIALQNNSGNNIDQVSNMNLSIKFEMH